MSYASVVNADAPRNWWRLSELGGQLAHDIGANPYPLEVLDNYGHLGYTGIASDGGSARVPNGEFISYRFTPPTLVPPWTLECWIWILGYFGKPQTFLDLGGMSLQMNGATRTPQFYANPTNLNSSGGDVSTNAWHHIVASLGAGTMTLYVDGTSAGTAVNGGTPAVTQTVIGAWADATRAFDGFIAECAVYSAALSGARVSAHYAAREVTTAPNWVEHGNINLTTGAVTNDSDILNQIKNAVTFTAY